MKKIGLWSAMALLAATMTFTSCSEDSIALTPATLNIEMPMGIENVKLNNGVATLTNVNSKEVYTVSNITSSNGVFTGTVNDVPVGTYNVNLTGDIEFTKNGVNGSSKIDQTIENVAIAEGNANVKFSVNTFSAEGGLLISEIYFTGSTTPEGNQYNNDQYLIISNNSDVTLYADSVAIIESAFLTTTKQDYTPDIMKDTASVDAIYMIPGSGKDVAVEPGKSLVIALNGKNHLEANSNSLDLSNADFEFYDESSNPNYLDEDNANVPNLDKYYCYTLTYFGLHNRGFKSYAIAKMQGDKEEFLNKNFYQAAYVFTFGEFSFDKSTDAYKIPNSWILDAVSLSVESVYQWQVFASSLDAGWAHCGSIDHDKTRYNKAVVRKKDSNGKWIDTNNSTNDFESDATPSLKAN